MTQELLPVPVEHEHQLPQHPEVYKPLGQSAVISEEMRVQAMLQADYHREAVDYIQQYAGYRDPRHGFSLRSTIGRLRGKNVPGKEVVEWMGATGGQDMWGVRGVHSREAKYLRDTKLTQEIEKIVELGKIRKTLREIDKPGRAMFEEYADQNLPEFLKQSYKDWKQDSDADIVDWLTEPENGDYEKPNMQLINFLQWHNHRSEEMNSNPETLARIATEKADFKAKVEQAVASGALPEIALEKLAAVDDTKVVIADFFDMQLRSRAGEKIVGESKFLLTEVFSSKTFRHEMTHNALGSLPVVYMNEAVTEHIAIALQDGKFDELDPEVHEVHGSYVGYRSLVDAELQSGTKPIQMERVLRIYLEDDEAAKAEQYHDLLDDINASFGFDVENYFLELGADYMVSSGTPELRAILSERTRKERALKAGAEGLRIAGAILHGPDAEAELRKSMADAYLELITSVASDLRDDVKAEMIKNENDNLDGRFEAAREVIAARDQP